MIPYQRLTAAALLIALAAVTAEARRADLLPKPTAAKLRHAAKAREKVSLPDVALGRPSLDTIELEPMDLWTPGAKIVVSGEGGPKTIDPPDAKYFRGRVKGEPQSAVFLSVGEKKMHGLVLVGDKRFALGTAKRIDKENADDDTVGLRELEAADDPSPGNWKCDVESKPVAALGRMTPKATGAPRDVQTHAGNNANSSYQLNLAIETDYELYVAFNSVDAITAYVESLVGNASVIFQRDLNTTLTVGNLQIHTIPQDPWTTVPLNGSIAALAQLASFWHADPGRAAVKRSAVVMISGKAFNSGRAFQGTLCGSDFSCGADGAVCGDLAFANGWGGAYAFCGTNGQPTTTVPDPTETRDGITYAMPTTNDYWMLFLFTHEVGHLANAPHTNCVQLTYEERLAYNVQRAFVDECLSGEASTCFSLLPSVPTELGTIMSGCHTLQDAEGHRAARYLFWEAGKPSAKMQAILRNNLDAATPDDSIRLGTYTNPSEEDSQPIGCAGRTAHVATCPSCTYAWSITGGSITGSAAVASITYTPTAPLVTLTVTITQPSGCGITTSRQITSACASVAAPAAFDAAANGAASVTVSWSAVAGAAKYEISRRSVDTTWAVAGNIASTAFIDLNVAPNIVYLYRVRGLDASGYPGTSSSTDFAATYEFSDPTLAAFSTPIRAAHLEELRTAVNGLRALGGLGAATFTDASLADISIKRRHIEELRARLAEAVTALGRPAPFWTDPVLADVSVVRTAHVAELRVALR